MFFCNTRFEIRPFALFPTNLHSTQSCLNKGNIKTCDGKIENFLDIVLGMCVVKTSKYRLYWDVTSRYENVASVIRKERFGELKKYLHFADSSTAPTGDGEKNWLFKIHPLFERLRQNCLTQIPEKHNNIDKKMIPFKGRSFLRR